MTRAVFYSVLAKFVTIQSHAKWKKNRELETVLFGRHPKWKKNDHVYMNELFFWNFINIEILEILNNYKIFVTIHSAESNLLL